MEKANTRQNHFAVKVKKGKNSSKPSGPKISVTRAKKPKLRIDRYGRPMDSKSETEFQKVMRDTHHNPVASSGNRFAVNSESSEKARLKRGRGIKFTLSFLTTLAAFVLVYVHPGEFFKANRECPHRQQSRSLQLTLLFASTTLVSN